MRSRRINKSPAKLLVILLNKCRKLNASFVSRLSTCYTTNKVMLASLNRGVEFLATLKALHLYSYLRMLLY